MEQEDATSVVRESLRAWISADDEIRALQAQIKAIRDRKNQYGAQVLDFMRNNELDNFVLEGSGGSISRQQRTMRPALRRNQVRTQLLLHFADQPQRVAEALRAIEGVAEDMSATSAVTKELLTRRIPRSQQIRLS